MQGFLSGDLGIVIFLVFFILVLGGLLVQHLVGKMRWEISMAEYELERGPVEEAPPLPAKEELLPGYSMLTYQDYEAIEKTLREELLKEMEKRS